MCLKLEHKLLGCRHVPLYSPWINLKNYQEQWNCKSTFGTWSRKVWISSFQLPSWYQWSKSSYKTLGLPFIFWINFSFIPLKGEEILSLKERPDHNPTSNYILLAIIQRSKYKSSSSLIYASCLVIHLFHITNIFKTMRMY